MINEKLKEKLDFYEKYYFSLDKPVPFLDGLKIYPVKVKNYYDFYSFYPCLTINKNIKKQQYKDEHGNIKEREVSNIEGLKMSYMAFLVNEMKKDSGAILTNRFISLMELSLHEKNGLYCPFCYQKDKEKEKKEVLKFEDIYNSFLGKNEQEKIKLFKEYLVCPKCGNQRREVFSYKGEGQIAKICIYNNELNSQDFEELKSVISHYNILNYDGDEYVDPDLKEELEIKAKLENKDYVSPTLEKQLVCISISTPYTIEMLKEITLRKMSFMLKMVDAKNNYYAQIQGAYSGMVKFKEDPKHWIFGDDGRDKNKDIMTLDNLKEKFKRVT